MGKGSTVLVAKGKYKDRADALAFLRRNWQVQKSKNGEENAKQWLAGHEALDLNV